MISNNDDPGKEKARIPGKQHDLYSGQPITHWDQGLPIGNGLLGCLVWGNGSPVHFSLDRSDLWDMRVAPETLVPDYTYEELIRLVHAKKHKKVHDRFEKFYFDRLPPTKIPAGKIKLDFGKACQNVKNRLVIYEAVALVTLHSGRKHSEVASWIHATENIGFLFARGSMGIPSVELINPDFSDSSEESRHLGYPEADYGADGIVEWFRQKTCEALEYAVVLAQKRSGDELLIAYSITTNKDGDNWLEDAKESVLKAVMTDFDRLRDSHLEWWSDFWKKSSICLPEPEFEKQWYLTNYLFGSCSRKGAPPIALQGVWTDPESKMPPWKGIYTNDLNTEMSYWHYPKANHLKEGECLVDFLWDLVPEARHFAGRFFDAPGICLPSEMSINGKSVGGYIMHSTNLVNQIFLCQAFDQYWLVNGDLTFLKEKAYPYFRETALCLIRWLQPGPDGKWVLPLSSSPEIFANTEKAWMTPNSNYDLALLQYLFITLSKMADTLDNGEGDRWREIKKQLPELATNRQNVLMLSPSESLGKSHRHLSHAMAIYPLNLLDYHSGSQKERDIIDATIADLELLGTGEWCGFSFTWMSALYSRQGNGEGAYWQLKAFWENICSPNGFCLNWDIKGSGITFMHLPIFTIETNFSAADSLQEMLLQSHHGIIRVFPAIPGKWRKEGASFQNFRGENGLLVSSEIINDKLKYILLHAEKDGHFNIQNKFGSRQVRINRVSGIELICCERDDIISIHLSKGESCKLSV